MGYQILARLAISKISESECKRLGEYAENIKLPLLRRFVWPRYPRKYIEHISREFPDIIFGLFLTGDNNDLCYYIINKGESTKCINFGADIENSSSLMTEEYQNQEQRRCEKTLIDKITEMNLTDISEMFTDPYINVKILYEEFKDIKGKRPSGNMDRPKNKLEDKTVDKAKNVVKFDNNIKICGGIALLSIICNFVLWRKFVK